VGALLSVRDLTIRATHPRGDIPIVESFSFDLMAGESVGLVGESGAGKSSIALALVGLLSPPLRVTGGEASFQGLPLVGAFSPGRATGPRSAWRSIRGARIGLLFQEPASALDPLMTLEAQVAEVWRAHRSGTTRQARRQAAAWLERMGLDRRVARSHPHQVSGGQRQRAALAAALIAGPSLLIADEPTTALDLETQRQVLDLLGELRRDLSLTLLLIGHDAAVLRYACSRNLELPAVAASGRA
jgi:ABC-type glutathione transport system ATPase component